MWSWCLYARMWILMFDRLCLCWLCCKAWLLIWNWVLGLCWELDRIQFDWWILSLREWMLFRTNRECGCVCICVTWVVWIIDNCLESWDYKMNINACVMGCWIREMKWEIMIMLLLVMGKHRIGQIWICWDICMNNVQMKVVDPCMVGILEFLLHDRVYGNWVVLDLVKR